MNQSNPTRAQILRDTRDTAALDTAMAGYPHLSAFWQSLNTPPQTTNTGAVLPPAFHIEGVSVAKDHVHIEVRGGLKTSTITLTDSGVEELQASIEELQGVLADAYERLADIALTRNYGEAS